LQDIPDAKGDSVAGVRTMTVRLGAHRVFWACIWILTAAYAGAVVYCLGAAAIQLMPGLFATPSGVLDAGSSVAHAVASAAHTPHLSPASLSLSSSATGSGVLGLFGSGSSAALGLVARTALCIAGHVGMAVALW
jgi:4-hydroxybenzoate polyprenyltransferase